MNFMWNSVLFWFWTKFYWFLNSCELLHRIELNFRVTTENFICNQQNQPSSLVLMNIHMSMLLAQMSSLRFCGALARRAITSQPNNVPSIIVPVAYKCRDLAKTPPHQYQQYRKFKNFGHKPTPIPGVTKIFHLIIGVGFLICTMNWRW